VKKIYIDFDGVILDTPKIYDKEFKNIKNMTREEYEKVVKKLKPSKIIKESKQINNSIQNIKKLIKKENYEVAILTHVLSIEEAVEKFKFFEKKIPGITVIIVPKEISKSKAVDPKDAILIDDYEINLKEWEKAKGESIFFSTKRKHEKYKTITSLEEIL